MKYVLFLLLSVHFTLEIYSQGDGKTKIIQPWMAGIFYDQDYTLEQLHIPLNEDRNYTMGLGILVSHTTLKNWCLFTPHYFLNNVFGKSFLNDKHNRLPENANAIMLGNGSFTPDSLPAGYVIKNDRPYGSITYLQTVTSSVNTMIYARATSTFTFGIIGSGVSKCIQTAIHEAMNENDTKAPRTPKGWHNQVSNGGELTLGYSFEKEKLITDKAVREKKQTSRFGIELKHGYRYSIGYYTMANYGFHFRFGKIDPRNWPYRVNSLGSSDKDAAAVDKVTYGEKDKTFECYVFGSLRPTFTLYNALLNGQFRKSEHTINFQDTRHLTLEAEGGAAISIPLTRRTLCELKLRVCSRSPEFKLPARPARFHYWGGIDMVISHS